MPKPWKVFKFPTGFDSEWTCISKDKHFESWSFGIGESLKWFKNRSLDNSIDDWLDYDFGRLALECYEGKHEDFVVWRAEQENPKISTEKVNCGTCKFLSKKGCIQKDYKECLGDPLTSLPKYKLWQSKKESLTMISVTDPNDNPSTFWLVWNPKGWSPPKYRHLSRYDAETEAARLARQMPGSEFYVLRVESKFSAGKVTKTEFVESDDAPF